MQGLANRPRCHGFTASQPQQHKAARIKTQLNTILIVITVISSWATSYPFGSTRCMDVVPHARLLRPAFLG